MSPSRNTPSSPATVVPTGTLLHLAIDDIVASRSNPRHLFDPPQLATLKSNIRDHGVLVPITVFQPKGQSKYRILDGERRYRCCVELREEGHEIKLPANVVAPPTKIAGLLYMFSIHNFREAWELMPTALGLRSVMDELGETDNSKLAKLTGLSEPQIERCKLLLSFPEKYQAMSLDPDPQARIPSNFWIELHPVVELCKEHLNEFYKSKGRSGIIDALIAKYRARKIKSVIHFRRVMEAYELADPDRRSVLKRIREYIEDINLETRQAFDAFVVDPKRVQSAIEACTKFIKDLERLKLDYSVDRDDLRVALNDVLRYTKKLLSKLEGQDAPYARRKESDD